MAARAIKSIRMISTIDQAGYGLPGRLIRNQIGER
nr:MAG TPA_asm: hypothetical protein [Caudoviricetes sp.]